MTFKKMNAEHECNYISPAIETLDFECEQAVLAGSDNYYGRPGEDPTVNDFGDF